MKRDLPDSPLHRFGRRPWWIALEWNISDVWVGLYWTWKVACYATAYGLVRRELHLYVCVLPCLPLHVILGVPRREEAP